MKNIVITSIFEPTKAVRAFAELQDYKLTIVGDKKSPSSYECENLEFLPWDKKMGFNIEDVLPYNHYCRKMIGYVKAFKEGAEIIIDTDDDNTPYENWFFPPFEGEFDVVSSNNEFINIYEFYTEQKIWPRGLPLDCINKKNEYKIVKENSKVGVWQALADGDPDVDAIYRLINNKPCYFNKGNRFLLLGDKTICPFNSQNTAFRKELSPLMYLPATVTFRFTDILRGLVAQPIMHLYGYKLGFLQATVFQERNEHDYMKDFASEVPMYTHSKEVVKIVENNISVDYSLEENILRAYKALAKNQIVTDEEIGILKAFLSDIKS